MTKTVSDVIAEALREAGVEVVFGLPGGRNVAPLEAIRQQGINFHLVRNENSAIFMAAARARLTGKPGVCLVTLGPGAANAYAGIAHAHLDRSPVLVITAQTEAELDGRHTHQVLDLQAMFRPVTKRTEYVTSDDPRRAVLDALRLTMQGRPGPVHLGFAGAVAIAAAGDAMPMPEPTSTAGPAPDLAVAREVLSRARRPLILAGLGLEPEGPYAELRQLAEAANAPVAVTPKAKGALPDDHPLSAGTIGLTRTDPVYELLDEADAVVAVGFDVVELVKPWEHDAPLIWVAPWENADPILPSVVEHVGAMGPALRELAAGAFATALDWGARRVAAHLAEHAWAPPGDPPKGCMWPQQVLSAIRASVPRDTLITTDIGSHKITMALDWPAYAPNRYWVSNGLSCMGSSLPGAMGAAMTLGEPVVCLTGDGGMAMVLGELGLLAEQQWPVAIVLLHDSALDLIRAGQQRRGLPAVGTEFVNPDYQAIAHAYRIAFHRVTTEADCGLALRRALETRRPAIVEAMIDPSTYPTHVLQLGG